MPDLDDLFDEAKDLIGDHKKEVKDGIGEAADFVGDKLGADKKTMKTVKETATGLVDEVAPDDKKPAKKAAKKTTKKPKSAS
jgi:hypothetical protein